jgi:uncharacterized protein YcaQ
VHRQQAEQTKQEAAQMNTYESDITRFLRELKEKHPDLERKQREGRAIWWDKEIDFDELRRFEQSKVPQPPYVYQTC